MRGKERLLLLLLLRPLLRREKGEVEGRMRWIMGRRVGRQAAIM